MPPKPDLVFTDEHVVSESVTTLPGIVKSKVKNGESKLKTISEAIIEDWVSDSEDENEIETNLNRENLVLLRHNLMLLILDGKKLIVNETSIRRDLKLDDAEGTTCLPNDTIFEELARMGFVQVFVNHKLGDMSHHKKIFVTPSNTKRIFANMKREGKGFSRRVTSLFPTMIDEAQVDIEPIPHETAEDNVSTHFSDPLLSGDDRLKLHELMDLCTKLSDRVLSLEKSRPIKLLKSESSFLGKNKTNQAVEIRSLKKRVNKLKGKKKMKTHELKRLYKVGLIAKVISLSDEAGLGDQEDASNQERKIANLDGDKGISSVDEHDDQMFDAEIDLQGEEVVVADPIITTDELTLAQALMEIKTSKPKAKSIAMQEPTDEELAQRLHAEEQEKLKKEQRIAWERVVEQKSLIEEWDNVQATINADRQLAEQLQAQERDELTVEEQVNKFVPMEVEEEPLQSSIVKESSVKRPGIELKQETTKKQKVNEAKVDDEQDEAEMKELMEIVPEKRK
nr:hypothetical protein [Tanacetum cinerariifolium]